MLCFVVNLFMMYQEYVFFDCFVVVVKDGFEGVEFFFFYDFDKVDICVWFDDVGFMQVLFNVLLGDWVGGECGIVLLFGCEVEFKCGIVIVLEYVQVFGNMCLYVMVGFLFVGVDCVCYYVIYVSNVVYVVCEVVGVGVIIVLELINMCDMLGFFFMYQVQVYVVCKEVGVFNLKVQFDLYYVQIMEGDLLVKFKQYIDGVGYVQIVGVFDCYELDEGELNYLYFFVLFDMFGYDGWVGCEYWLCVGMSEGLGWFKCWWEGWC